MKDLRKAVKRMNAMLNCTDRLGMFGDLEQSLKTAIEPAEKLLTIQDSEILPEKLPENKKEYPTRKEMTDIGYAYGFNAAIDEMALRLVKNES